MCSCVRKRLSAAFHGFVCCIALSMHSPAGSARTSAVVAEHTFLLRLCRYVLSTALGLFNKKVVGKNYGVFGKGAFPGVQQLQTKGPPTAMLAGQQSLHDVAASPPLPPPPAAALCHVCLTGIYSFTTLLAAAASAHPGHKSIQHMTPAHKACPYLCVLPAAVCPVLMQLRCFSLGYNLHFRICWLGWCLPLA
jgi:hypothetical protein